MSPIPMIFKFNTLVSVPFFMATVFLILRKTKAFSYSQLTISRSIHLLSPVQRLIFQFNFVIKALIDAGFVWYIATALDLSFYSPLILLWTVTILAFGLFAYFTDDRSRKVHEIYVYSWIFLWLCVELVSSVYTKNVTLFYVTMPLVIFQAIVAYGAGLLRKTNAIIQFICVLSLYIWLILFTNSLG